VNRRRRISAPAVTVRIIISAAAKAMTAARRAHLAVVVITLLCIEEPMFSLRLATLVLVLGGCAASTGSSSVPRSAVAALGPRAECKVTATQHKPLVVDWAQDERTDLEAELRQKQVVVVAYDCNELRLMPECHLQGDYGYTGVTRKETVQHFEGETEIGLNLPLNGLGIAAKLGAKTGRDAALDLALVTVGQRRSTRVTATRDDLVGQCDAATHFIRE
jgi:hypothetical protein